MKANKTVILDFDGPILETSHRQYACYLNAAKALGVNTLSQGDFWRLKRQAKPTVRLLPADTSASVLKDFSSAWLSNIETSKYLALDELQPQVCDKLRRWKSLGLSLILVTVRQSEQGVLNQVNRFQLSEFLDDVIVCRHESSEELKAHALMKRWPNFDTSTAVWIGDTEVDARSAQKLGIKLILVANGIRSTDLLQILKPDLMRDSLATIDEADVLWR